MSKHFLIRKNLEHYVGPYTLSELLIAYKKQEFALNDEIAGSCGEWIALDDINKLKRTYPDLGRIVHENLLGGWDIDKPQRSPRRSPKRKKSSSLPLVTVLVLVVATLSALFTYKYAKGRWFDIEPIASFEQLLRNDPAQFEIQMKDHLPVLIKRVSKSKKLFLEWLPLLRAYAFEHANGRIEGIPAHLFRDAVPAPHDCSVEAWTQTFAKSKSAMLSLIEGRAFVAEPWSQILMWDSRWITRRSPFAGWLSPPSYFAACVHSAEKSLRLLESQDPFWRPVRQRLVNVLTQINPQKSLGTEISSSPLLGFLDCVDQAPTTDTLLACQLPQEAHNDQKTYAAIYQTRAWLMRLAVVGPVIAADALQDLRTQLATLPVSDPVTQFDYAAEQALLGAIVKNNGDVGQAIREVESETTHVRFLD